jgi:hypothetical protein
MNLDEVGSTSQRIIGAFEINIPTQSPSINLKAEKAVALLIQAEHILLTYRRKRLRIITLVLLNLLVIFPFNDELAITPIKSMALTRTTWKLVILNL